MTRSVVQLGGQALKLDADGDTTIEVSSDDVLIVDTAGNEALKINADGYVTKPLQPYFHVGIDTTGGATPQSNISNSAYVNITLDNEIIDRGGNFASNTFTAPVTGTYHLTLNIRLDNVDTAASYYNLVIATSNRHHQQLFTLPDSDIPIMSFKFTAIADMDASDTAYCRIFQNGGTSQTDINGYNTSFYGYLLG